MARTSTISFREDLVDDITTTNDFEERTTRRRLWCLSLLCITVALLFADQNLLAPNLSVIANEFHFTPSERDAKLGGEISLGFFIVGAPAALLVGYLTDSFNRCRLCGWIVILGEASCGATYFVQNYSQLFACRVLTGISIGGAAPVIFSLLADLYPGDSRIQMSTLVGIAMSAGIAMGQLIAGMMGPVLGWRSPFLVISAPCLLCGLLVMFTCVEPVRGGQEEEVLVMRRAREKFVISSPPSRTRLSEMNEDLNNNGQTQTQTQTRSSSGRMRGSRGGGVGAFWDEEDDDEEQKKGYLTSEFNQQHFRGGQGLGLGGQGGLGGLGLGLGMGGSEPSSSSTHRSTGPPSIHPSYGATNGIDTNPSAGAFATAAAAANAATAANATAAAVAANASASANAATDRDRGVGPTTGLIGTTGGPGMATTSYIRTFTSGSDEEEDGNTSPNIQLL